MRPQPLARQEATRRIHMSKLCYQSTIVAVDTECLSTVCIQVCILQVVLSRRLLKSFLHLHLPIENKHTHTVWVCVQYRVQALEIILFCKMPFLVLCYIPGDQIIPP